MKRYFPSGKYVSPELTEEFQDEIVFLGQLEQISVNNENETNNSSNKKDMFEDYLKFSKSQK